jgi:predicted RND superfamily exporter protein
LVFSIAFGISVDDTIHFLAKFRQEAKLNNWNIKDATVKALEETGVSMTYTSIVLFFGFAVFASSQFGGTQALGVLVSITLFTAIFSNLILLPAFLMTINDRINKKIFGDPLIDIYQEEEDIELSDLKLNNLKNNEK